MEPKLKNELMEESKIEHRSFTNYIEMLLETHPNRNKNEQIKNKKTKGR